MPARKFTPGDLAQAITDLPNGGVTEGEIGIVQYWDEWGGYYVVDFPSRNGVAVYPRSLALVKPKVDRRRAEKIMPTTEREQIAVDLVTKVVKGEGKFTAVKVESEGRLNRRDMCNEACTWRTERKPHVGCKRFNDVKVAQDYILRELAKVGLAKRCKYGETIWGYLYKPCTPLVFSKVYTDSETEWTTTLLLKRPEDVLFAPFIVDAFNALAAANGNGIDVSGSGMHTAFIQGAKGVYPSDPIAGQQEMFENFAKSMRPLLPALYLLGANRMQDGEGITRSTNPRQPIISSTDKYSAVAYRYGALEFRVFDTCYDNRDQLLDNIVVMAQAVSKYWHKKYNKPSVLVDKPVYFGNNEVNSHPVNKLECLYVVKDHIVLLNKGLRCIKPPYMTVKELKHARNFKLTVRGIKNTISTEAVEGQYARHLREIEVNRIRNEASEFYYMVDRMGSGVEDIKKYVKNCRAKAKRMAKKAYTPKPIEKFAYENQFGRGYPLGES